MGCKLELLIPRDPLFISGNEGKGIKPRKPGSWNRKTAAPRASLHCGQRKHSLLLAGPAKPRLRQAAPLSGCSDRRGASHPHTKQIFRGLPGFPLPSLRPPEVGDKEMRHYVCKWEAACVIKIECVRLRQRRLCIQLRSWNVILEEQREAQGIRTDVVRFVF